MCRAPKIRIGSGPGTDEIVMREVVLVSASSSKKKVLQFFKSREVQEWLYLGKNYTQLQAWEQLLPLEQRLPIGGILADKTWKLRRPYVEWIAAMGRPYGDSLSWWTSNLADKNIDGGDLFLNLCYLEIAEEVRQRGGSPVLMIIEDWALGVTLEEVFHRRGAATNNIGCGWRGHLKGTLKEALLFGRRWAQGFTTLARHYWAARRTRHFRQPARMVPGRPGILLHTCIDEACLGTDGHFTDRYFTDLPAWLRKQGFAVATLVWPHNLRRPLKDAFSWFRRNREVFIIPEDHFRLKDYCQAIGALLRQLRVPKTSPPFQGKDVSPLIFRERLRQASEVDKVRFLLYPKVIQGLKRFGWNLNYYVDMFENMGIEKPVIRSVHEVYPEATVLAFQHAPFSPTTLAYAVGAWEVQGARRVFPDRLICSGQRFLEILAADGFPDELLREGPALRYLYLFDNRGPQSSPPGPADLVLVTLPLALDAAVEVLHSVLLAFADLPCRVALKTHPMMERQRLLRAMGPTRMPDSFFWADGDMDSWLSRAACVVGTATAAIFEAVAAGVPLVVLGRQVGLEQNPLAWWEKVFPMFGAVHRPEEMRATVAAWLDLSPVERQKRMKPSRDFLRDCFNPWNEGLLKDFFNPHESGLL